jgi:hypothetical protein
MHVTSATCRPSISCASVSTWTGAAWSAAEPACYFCQYVLASAGQGMLPEDLLRRAGERPDVKVP